MKPDSILLIWNYNRTGFVSVTLAIAVHVYEVCSISNLNVSVSCYWVKRLLNLQKKNSALVYWEMGREVILRVSAAKLIVKILQLAEYRQFVLPPPIFNKNTIKNHFLKACCKMGLTYRDFLDFS